MSTEDFSRTPPRQTLAELQRLLAETDAAIAERRIEELKVLADGYAKKLAMNGFSIQEGMDALKPYRRLRPR